MYILLLHMINLITSFFRPGNTERLNELVVCLKNNINSKYIKKIYLFMESKEDIEFLKETIKTTGNKIQLILWKKQPTYADYLNLANQLKGEICMISNADIWLKECDIELINLIKTNKNIGYSLSRHEHDMSCPLIERSLNAGKFSRLYQSYDSFIFKSPININYKLISHIQNRMGAENIFKIELEKIGMQFINPCKCIIIVHEHKSCVRTYDEKDDMLTASIRHRLKYTPIANTHQIINHFNTKKH